MKNYKKFWHEIKDKVELLAMLDSNNELVFASKAHKYIINPILQETDIIEFESENVVKLPEAYRTFLLFYGSGGAGPNYGIYDFNSDIIIRTVGELTLDSELTSFFGCDTEISMTHPIHKLNGVIKVSTGGNPSDYFMVVTGKEIGRVFAWNHDDILCDKGLFDEWFQNWVNKSLSLFEDS